MNDVLNLLTRIEYRLSNIEEKLSLKKPAETNPVVQVPASESTFKEVPTPSTSDSSGIQLANHSENKGFSQVDSSSTRSSTVTASNSSRADVKNPVLPKNLTIPKDELSGDKPAAAIRLMGSFASLAFILAIIYFLKLVYETGWLTPMRQVGLAYLSAGGLIAAGLYFRDRARFYLSYLPAVGVVVLYLTTFAAGFVYHLFKPQVLMVVVGMVTLLGVWLGRQFRNSAYVLLAAIGVYLTPLLMPSANGQMTELLIYYLAAGFFFCYCSFLEGNRLAYLIPMYMGMLGFDSIWRLSNEEDWLFAITYQLVQFCLFSVNTALFSIRLRKPLEDSSLIAHLLGLFIFYHIAFGLLNQYLPEFAHYVAICSGLFVLLIFMFAKRFFPNSGDLNQGSTVVSWYCSWILVHAVFFGVIPDCWFAWSVLTIPVILIFAERLFKESEGALLPIRICCGGIYFYGYAILLLTVIGEDADRSPLIMPSLTLAAHAILLFGIYLNFSRVSLSPVNSVLALYGAHLAAIVGITDIMPDEIYSSLAWAVYALFVLVTAVQLKDKALGRSALLIFLLAGVTILLFGLAGSSSVVKILLLLAFSVVMYLGGWFYQNLLGDEDGSKSNK